MASILHRFRAVIALCIGLLFASWFAAHPLNSKFAFARGFQITVLAPVQAVVSRFAALVQMKEEVRGLRVEAARLTVENAALEQARRENEELRQMVGYQKGSSFSLVPAEVIAVKRDVTGSAMVVAAGTKDGIKKNRPVITVAGVVGKVVETYPFHSVVRLLDDPASRTGVLFKRLGVSGILDCPDGRVGRVEFQRHVQVLPGDTLVTSGLGGLYPKGLTVGTVLRVEDGSELLKVARVRFHRGLRSVEHAFILQVESRWSAFPDSSGIELEETK